MLLKDLYGFPLLTKRDKARVPKNVHKQKILKKF